MPGFWLLVSPLPCHIFLVVGNLMVSTASALNTVKKVEALAGHLRSALSLVLCSPRYLWVLGQPRPRRPPTSTADIAALCLSAAGLQDSVFSLPPDTLLAAVISGREFSSLSVPLCYPEREFKPFPVSPSVRNPRELPVCPGTVVLRAPKGLSPRV